MTPEIPNFTCTYFFLKKVLTRNTFGWFNFRFVATTYKMGPYKL